MIEKENDKTEREKRERERWINKVFFIHTYIKCKIQETFLFD